MPVFRVLVSLLLMASSKAGAVGAGATGALLSAGVVTGQIPVPEGLSQADAALYLGIGPSLAWLFTRMVAAPAALFIRRRDNRRRRLAEMLALPIAERGEDSGKHMRRLADEADFADEIAAALEAVRIGNSNTHGGTR